MAKSLPAMAQACPMGTTLLKERGLARHPEQTRLAPRTEGVDCLGCHVQRRGPKRLITPQQQTGQARLQEIRAWVKPHATVTAAGVMHPLNPRMRGWAMDDRHVVSQHPCRHVDDHSWQARWRGVKRRHPKQPQRGLSRRSFDVGKYGATFDTDSRGRRGPTIRLRRERMPTIPIVRHVQGKGRASPEDPTLNASWEARRLTRGRQRVARGSLR